MEYVNLMGALQGCDGLDAFARQFVAAAEASDFEERESVNFPGGRYFRGKKADLVFTIASSDEDANEDLPYWVQVTSDVREGEALGKAVDELVRSHFLSTGFKLAKIINFGRRDEQRLDY